MSLLFFFSINLDGLHHTTWRGGGGGEVYFLAYGVTDWGFILSFVGFHIFPDFTFLSKTNLREEMKGKGGKLYQKLDQPVCML